ncbi:hypothetical protein [Ferruginibacter sp.]
MDLQNIFWICWAAEMLVILFWIASEIKVRLNPLSFFGAIYLFAALALKINMGTNALASVMVLVPAIPLFLMLFVMTLHSVSEGRGNMQAKKITE